MKVPQSLRDLVEGAESLVYVEDLSGKKGVMQAINPVAKLVAIIGMIIASLFITNLILFACNLCSSTGFGGGFSDSA